VSLNADSAFYLNQGQAVFVANAPTEGLVRIYGPEERFLGIGQVQDDGRIGPKRLIQYSDT
jgi:tRNA pseudouridine55 synthase